MKIIKTLTIVFTVAWVCIAQTNISISGKVTDTSIVRNSDIAYFRRTDFKKDIFPLKPEQVTALIRDGLFLLS